MKKLIIIAAIIVSSSALTAFAFSRNDDSSKAVNTLKIEKTDFTIKNTGVSASNLATAD